VNAGTAWAWFLSGDEKQQATLGKRERR